MGVVVVIGAGVVVVTGAGAGVVVVIGAGAGVVVVTGVGAGVVVGGKHSSGHGRQTTFGSQQAMCGHSQRFFCLLQCKPAGQLISHALPPLHMKNFPQLVGCGNFNGFIGS